MNTAFLLMAQYGGAAVISLDRVCADYFQHLTPAKLAQKTQAGEIALPIVRMDRQSQKSAKGVHLADLAAWIDQQREAAHKELDQITGKR